MKTPALAVKVLPVHIRKCGKYSKAFKRERLLLNWKAMKWIRKYSCVPSLPLSAVTTSEFFSSCRFMPDLTTSVIQQTREMDGLPCWPLIWGILSASVKTLSLSFKLLVKGGKFKPWVGEGDGLWDEKGGHDIAVRKRSPVQLGVPGQGAAAQSLLWRLPPGDRCPFFPVLSSFLPSFPSLLLLFLL